MSRMRFAIGAASVLAAAVVMVPLPSGAAPPSHAPAYGERRVCPEQGAGVASCDAHVRTLSDGVTPAAGHTPDPNAKTPAQLRAAYNLNPAIAAMTAAGLTPTVAVVDAYDNHWAQRNLDAYRKRFSIPTCVGTGYGAAGCLTIVNQTGATAPLPVYNYDWAGESDIDIQMVSAVCPMCRILLIEASTNNISDLSKGVQYGASRSDVVAISNSYSAKEWSGQRNYEVAYTAPGKAVVASSGDNGFGPRYPASSAKTVAVGGTSLYADSTTTRGWRESAWTGGGSGCSTITLKQSWQQPFISNASCKKRALTDVSAVADPYTGVAVYDLQDGDVYEWWTYGGTSVAAPIIASTYALAREPSQSQPAATDDLAAYPYQRADRWTANRLNDVTTGKNKSSCGGATKNYLCVSGPGYDGPTGLGTPNGVTAFAKPPAV